jgi:nucleolar GTP-binding protein
MSNINEEGIATVKKAACESLLEQRTQAKLKGKRMLDIANRIHLAEPVKRDEKERPPVVPETLGEREEAALRIADFERQKDLYHDMDDDYEGIDRRKRYILEKDDWKFDKVPEIMDGKNVFDFWSEDIEDKLASLEREEILRLRKLEQELEQQVSDGLELTEEQQYKLEKIRAKRTMLVQKSRMNKSIQDPAIPRKYNVEGRTLKDLEAHLAELGLDGKRATARMRESSRSRSRSRGLSESRAGRKRTREEMSQERALSKTPKPGSGMKDLKAVEKAERIADRAKTKIRREGRLGESDRHIGTKKPKFLYTGSKSGLGTSSIGR